MSQQSDIVSQIEFSSLKSQYESEVHRFDL